MITVILENAANLELARICHPGNEGHLVRHEPSYPLLSLLSEVAYDVFGHSDMTALIDELEHVRNGTFGGDRAHIEQVIKLAILCRDQAGSTLTFTPFE
jgi:hypothetical protein